MKTPVFTPQDKADLQKAAPYAASDPVGGDFWKEVADHLGQSAPEVEPRQTTEN